MPRRRTYRSLNVPMTFLLVAGAAGCWNGPSRPPTDAAALTENQGGAVGSVGLGGQGGGGGGATGGTSATGGTPGGTGGTGAATGGTGGTGTGGSGGPDGGAPAPDARPPDQRLDTPPAPDAASPDRPRDQGGPEGPRDLAPPSDAPPPMLPGPRNRARVFFSGHSLLDGVPQVFLAIAQSKGEDVNYNQQIVIGSPIRFRTRGEDPNGTGWPGYSLGANRNGSGMSCIQELRNPATLGPGERYDTLVITERHDILDTIEWEDTTGYLRHYHDRLIEGNPQGMTLFYHTWLDIDRDDPAPWITHEKHAQYAWECAASKVNLTLAAAGRSDRVIMLPGGGALVRLVEQILADQVSGISGSTAAKLGTIFEDTVHLTATGTYFIALVHYAAVFRKSPAGSQVPAGVSAATAADLQRIAWEHVSGYYNQPRPGEHTMEECRAYIPQNLCATYWAKRGQPQGADRCRSTFADPDYAQNPFRWPDPMLRIHPPPP